MVEEERSERSLVWERGFEETRKEDGGKRLSKEERTTLPFTLFASRLFFVA